MNIRRAKESDLQKIKEFNQAMSKSEAEKYDETINAEFPTSEEGEEYFRQRIQNSLALIVEENNERIGYLVAAIHRPESYRNTDKIAEVENMYVDPDHRSKGLGTKLIDEFKEWAGNQDAERIRVEASAQNKQAVKFYRKNGFEDYSITLEEEI